MPEFSELPFGMHDAVTTLPPSKRYICTHNAQGKSVVHSSPPHQYFGMPGEGGAARSYSTAATPITLKDDVDVDAYLAKTGPTSHSGHEIRSVTGKGSNLIVVDLAPGKTSQFHRTVTVDYSICVIGHIRMELDSGEFIDLQPGDHVIQRGTNHKWYNGSQTEPARLIAVTLPCESFEIPGTGQMLEEVHIEGSEAKDFDPAKL